MYQLDSSQRVTGKKFYAGDDYDKAKALVDSLAMDHYRPNLEQREDGLYVCWDNHEKHEACEYEKAIEYPVRYHIAFLANKAFYPGYRDPNKLLLLPPSTVEPIQEDNGTAVKHYGSRGPLDPVEPLPFYTPPVGWIYPKCNAANSPYSGQCRCSQTPINVTC